MVVDALFLILILVLTIVQAIRMQWFGFVPATSDLYLLICAILIVIMASNIDVRRRRP